MTIKYDQGINLSMKTFFSTLLFLSVGNLVKSDDLDLTLNAPLNSKLASTWVLSLQTAYDSFLNFVSELNNNFIASRLTTTKELTDSARTCFNLLKRRTLSSVEDLKITARAVSSALTKTIVCGIRAIGNLVIRKEKEMAQTLANTIDLMQKALEITYHLISQMH